MDDWLLVNGAPFAWPTEQEPECTCRRCLLHDDPAGCLVRFPPEAQR